MSAGVKIVIALLAVTVAAAPAAAAFPDHLAKLIVSFASGGPAEAQ
jgi:hypothetical protein